MSARPKPTPRLLKSVRWDDGFVFVFVFLFFSFYLHTYLLKISKKERSAADLRANEVNLFFVKVNLTLIIIIKTDGVF